MNGFVLGAGVLMLAATAVTLAARLTSSIAELLLAAYLLAFAEIVVLSLVLSSGRWLTGWTLLAGIMIACALSVASWSRWPPDLSRFSGVRASVSSAAREPVIVTLAIVVAGALVYAAALSLFTPQNADDALYYHLARAALWKQHHGLTWLHGAFDPRLNANPPHAEIGMLATILLSGSDRFVGLVQASAFAVLPLATYQLSRRLGLATREALMGGLLFATLPVVILQSGQALNDLVVGVLVVTAVVFIVSPSKRAPWLVAIALALAVGTKVSVLFVLPLLLGLILAFGATRRLMLLAAGCVGAVIGGYWYALNIFETGVFDGHLASSQHQLTSHAPLAALSRSDQLLINAVDLPGAIGADRYLYVLAAIVLSAVGMGIVLARRRGVRPSLWYVAAAVLTALPIAFVPLSRALNDAHWKLWVAALHRPDLAKGGSRDITQAGLGRVWYGPLLLILVAVSLLLVIRLRRRGRLPTLALVLALAPFYGIVAIGFSLPLQEWSGRFLMPEVALAASTWGLVLRVRPIAWATVAIGVTTLLLTLVHYDEKPSGLQLLAAGHARAVWGRPRWETQITGYHEAPIRPTLQFINDHVPADTTIHARLRRRELHLPVLRPSPSSTHPLRQSGRPQHLPGYGMGRPRACIPAATEAPRTRLESSRPEPRLGGLQTAEADETVSAARATRG